MPTEPVRVAEVGVEALGDDQYLAVLVLDRDLTLVEEKYLLLWAAEERHYLLAVSITDNRAVNLQGSSVEVLSGALELTTGPALEDARKHSEADITTAVFLESIITSTFETAAVSGKVRQRSRAMLGRLRSLDNDGGGWVARFEELRGRNLPATDPEKLQLLAEFESWVKADDVGLIGPPLSSSRSPDAIEPTPPDPPPEET